MGTLFVVYQAELSVKTIILKNSVEERRCFYLKRRPKKYYRDICFDYFEDEVFVATVTAAVFCALLLGLILVSVSSEHKATLTKNETAQEFNALSLHERQLIAKWSDTELDEETFLMEINDDPLTVKEAWLPLLIIAIGIVLCFFSGSVAYGYCTERNSDYFLADLPLGIGYGWFLLFALFTIWPFMFISAIRMWFYFRPNRKAERAEVEKQAEAELSEEQIYALAQSPKMRNYSAARQAYINYRLSGRAQAQQKLIEATEERIEEIKQTIRDYGQKIQKSQHELGEAKAELESLSTTKVSAQATRTQAKAEWKILTEMRGVAKLTAHKGRGKRPDKICILVKVRVPYHNNVYDFGDYQITLCGDRYSCDRVRSGIRVDHTSTQPSYNESSGFCFGSRRSTIMEYLEQGKTIEAVTLMVDCLHSVNEGHEIYIPDCFRKVATVERAKRRLKRQAKNKGGK